VNGNEARIEVEHLYVAPGCAPGSNGMAICTAGDSIAGIAPSSGGRGLLALPALADAHDHCRGLHHIAFGAKDQNFELWRAALYAQPPLDPYLNAALAFGRLAQAGVGSVTHVYSSSRVDRLAEDAEAIARAARDVGVRLGFAVPLRDRQTLGYGADEELLALHDERDWAVIGETWLPSFPTPDIYMQLVGEIARRIEGPMISVHLGPNSPQACSDALLEAVADMSAREGRRITTHLLETSIQREWADATFPQGFVRHLCDLGIICERFTGAHGVWLTPADIALLAERNAQIAVNASSNLRLRSGVAPVARFITERMPFCFGVDSFAFDDDEDAFRELRIAHWLFSPHDTKAPLTPELLFNGWQQNGYLSVNNRSGYGRLEPGAPADIVVLDYEAMAFDVIEDMIDPLDVVLTRATARHVKSLYVSGREIVRDGRVLGVDLPAIEREVITQGRAHGIDMRRLRPVLERSQRTLRSFYQSGGHRSGNVS
jgi:cytosine/adenosine deaminase-related metal-dependent hydrolase